MATDMPVRPGQWNELFGVWFRVLPDPLAGPKEYLVSVHREPTGAVWVRVSQPNGGVHVQTVPPDVNDFADLDGGPL